MAVSNADIMEKTADFIIDTLTDNITDPVTNRTTKVGNSAFVALKGSGRPLLYPCIVVDVVNVNAGLSHGAQSEGHEFTITCEIDVYQKKTKEKALILADDVINTLRQQQYGASGAIDNELYGFRVNSVVPIPPVKASFGSGGSEDIHRYVITIQYNFITDGI